MCIKFLKDIFIFIYFFQRYFYISAILSNNNITLRSKQNIPTTKYHFEMVTSGSSKLNCEMLQKYD